MPDQYHVVAAQVLDQEFEVLVERADYEIVGIVRNAVSSEVERDDKETIRKMRRDVVPPVRVRTTAMQEDELWFARITPRQIVQRGRANSL